MDGYIVVTHRGKNKTLKNMFYIRKTYQKHFPLFDIVKID